jgi:U3 small nucleolar RNA-associated protein 20
MDVDEAPEQSSSQPNKDALAKIRKLSIRRLGQIMRDYRRYNFAIYESEILFIIDSEVEKLHQQVANEKAGSVMDLALILSRHPTTALFLQPSLKKVLTCLTLPNVSYPVRTELYNLLDNLLRLRDHQFVDDDDRMEVDENATPAAPIDLVRPHVDLLLEAFRIRFSSDYGTRRRKIGQRELTLVERLSPYATSTVAADQLIALLLPFLRMKGIQLTAREHILTIFRNLVHLLTNPMSWAPTVARLFMSFPTPSSRTAACAAYESLSAIDSSLKVVAPLLTDLNSFLENRATEEPNYDRRFAAYQKINEELLPTLTETQLLPIVYNYLHFLAHPDLSLRSNASHGLAKLIQLIAAKQHSLKGVAALLPDIVLPAIRRNLDHANVSARAEYVDLLRILISSAPNIYPDLYAFMKHEGGENWEEENFFATILHLQMHRRTKAVQKFVIAMKSGAITFSTDTLMSIIFPIFKISLLEATIKQHNYVDDMISAVAAIARVVDWTKYCRIIQTFVDAMPKLPLIENQLVKLVVRVLDEFHFDVSKDFGAADKQVAPKNFSVEKAVTEEVKVLFAADVAAAKEGEEPEAEAGTAPKPEKPADAMDVDVEEKPEAAPAAVTEAVAEEPDEDEEEEPQPEPQVPAQPTESDADRLQRTIQGHLVHRLLPTLHNRLKESKGSHTVRAPVALAIIKLLQLMPTSISEFQIARLLTRLCAELASRAQANRDSCRETLRQILIKLGGKYFPFVLQMMQANLIRGYQMHVLSYSVHDLLKALVGVYKPGELDPALPYLQKILFTDMLGVAEEQRSEAKIQHSMKETKKSYALDSFQLMAQAVDFKQSSLALIGPVKDTLAGTGISLTEENSTMKQSDVVLIKKLSDVLDQIVIGFKQNSSVKAEDLFVFCYLMIKENMDGDGSAAAEDEKPRELTEEEKKKQKARPFRKQRMQMDPRKAAKFMIEPDPRKMRNKLESIIAGNEHILAVFALQLLQTFLKAAEQPGQSPIDRKSAEHIAMVDPFVKLLFKCMTSRFDRLLVTALKVLCQIIKIPNMPTVKSKCEAIGKRAIVLLQKSNPHSELLQMSFKTLTTLYREVKTFELGEHHLNIVMNFLRTAMETLENPNLVFSLFKSLVWRKVLHPTVYDMIPQLNEMLVQTASQSVRSHCEAIMMQFLLTYPLGEKRLQQHLDALIANLNYEYEPGRLALLNVMYAIFGRFPQAVIQPRLEYFTLPLVAQMINDDSKQCRSRAAEVLSAIIKSVDSDHKAKLLSSYCLTTHLSFYSYLIIFAF